MNISQSNTGLEEMSGSGSAEILPMALTSFPQFSSLPAEIRQMIWQVAVFPRIVYLEMVDEAKHTCSRVWSMTSIEGPESIGFFDLDNQSTADRLRHGPWPLWSFKSQSIPPLFHTCKESQRVAERIYSKSFGTECAPPTTWFNFELDTLYLDWGVHDEDEEEMSGVDFSFGPIDLSEDVKKVQNLAIYGGEHPLDTPVHEWIDHVLDYLGNVQSLTMVIPSHERDECANLVFFEDPDIYDRPEYSFDDADFHPVLWEVFPELEAASNSHLLWNPSEHLWTRDPFILAGYLNDATPVNQPRWTKPELQCKPVITQQRTLDFLQRKLEFDRERRPREWKSP